MLTPWFHEESKDRKNVARLATTAIRRRVPHQRNLSNMCWLARRKPFKNPTQPDVGIFWVRNVQLCRDTVCHDKRRYITEVLRAEMEACTACSGRFGTRESDAERMNVHYKKTRTTTVHHDLTNSMVVATISHERFVGPPFRGSPSTNTKHCKFTCGPSCLAKYHTPQ
jgi:hypothetical protein